jgi:hypothetical protein
MRQWCHADRLAMEDIPPKLLQTDSRNVSVVPEALDFWITTIRPERQSYTSLAGISWGVARAQVSLT